MLSTAKAAASARDLKEALEKRGFAVVESNLAKGKKLAIDADMSIKIEAQDAVSKDIFGGAIDSFSPHSVKFAVDNAVATHSDVAKVMLELSKKGFDIRIGEGATLAAAETASDSAAIERYNVNWPTKGA
jgi:hypothetical protein